MRPYRLEEEDLGSQQPLGLCPPAVATQTKEDEIPAKTDAEAVTLVEALYTFPALFHKHRRPDEPLSNIYYRGPEQEHSTPLMSLCIATLCTLKGEPRSKKAEALMTDTGERKSICV